MNWKAVSFDWNQVRAFLATVEEGSLSAAARALNLTQPTLSRQVTALEENLGVVLFERGARSMTLTESGLQLLQHVRAMGEAANRISLAASGQSQSIRGLVRITSTLSMATYHLPPVFKKLRMLAPELELDITTSNSLRNLTRREADIAIRHARPEEPELIAKLVGEVTVSLYASSDYLDKIGRPQTIEQFSDAEFIGFDAGIQDELMSQFHAFGVKVTPKNFKVSSVDGTVSMALARAGVGIGLLLKEDVKLFPDLEPVIPGFEALKVPLWLVTHRELHTSRKIRLVFDTIAEELANL